MIRQYFPGICVADSFLSPIKRIGFTICVDDSFSDDWRALFCVAKPHRPKKAEVYKYLFLRRDCIL